MAHKTVLMLNGGGLKSLAAASLLRFNEPETRLWLLFIDDGRPSQTQAFAHAQKQAEALKAFRLDRVQNAFNPKATLPTSQQSPSQPTSPMLRRTGALLTALAFARQRGIEQVTAPLACDQDFDQSAAITQQLVCCQELVAAEPAPEHVSADRQPPIFETPLLDFSHAQVLELASQCQAPFEWAWSCVQDTPTPCGQCKGCRARKQAFDQAGLQDPALSTQHQRRAQAERLAQTASSR